MSPTNPQNPLSLLNPISDTDAARAVGSETMTDLAAAIVATPAPPHRRRRPGASRRHVRRPMLPLAVVAGAVTALVLGVAGVLGSHDPTQAQPAAAAVLRGAAAALAHSPGSIVIDTDSNAQVSNLGLLKVAPGFKQGHGLQTTRWTNHEITETPVGNGPQNVVNLGGPCVTNGVQIGEVNGNNELYDPTTNTVYISSQFGSDITTGAKPGTFYKQPKLQGARPGSVAAQQNAHRPPPLTISAAQARALRDGTAQIEGLGSPEHPSTYRMKIAPAFRVTSATAVIQAQLKAGNSKWPAQRPSTAAKRSNSCRSTVPTNTTSRPAPTTRSKRSSEAGPSR